MDIPEPLIKDMESFGYLDMQQCNSLVEQFIKDTYPNNQQGADSYRTIAKLYICVYMWYGGFQIAYKQLETEKAIQKSKTQSSDIRRMDFCINYKNADGEYTISSEKETVLYNQRKISDQEVQKLIRNGKYRYDDRIVVTTPEKADSLRG